MRAAVDRETFALLQALNRRDFLGIGFFVHPLPAAAVALLAFNDHYFKYACPGRISGKLSDFCGLFFFPLFLCALWVVFARIFAGREARANGREDLLQLWLSRKMLVVAIVITDLVFVAVKLSTAGADLVESLLNALGFPSTIVSDPWDLLALSVNGPLLLYARRFY